VYSLGKLDKGIYHCITEDFMTEEVIITEEQLAHISTRHPEVLQCVIDNMKLTLKDPDYIIEDKRKNSGLVIKRIRMKEEYLQIVLRICTSQDKAGYKNSVISCWEISEKRLQNYLRNKRILYRKE